MFFKIYNLYILLGRHQCLCEASKHNLISNCLNCGRIVCEQEGVGPCFTCGTYIFTKEERNKLLSGTNEAKIKIEQLIKDGAILDFIADANKGDKFSLKDIAASIKQNQESLDKAIEHKNKLLNFDRNSVARSKVYDDEIDYFALQNVSW